MKVSESTKQYFSKIGERAEEYFNSIQFAKEYVLSNEVVRTKSIVDCMLMSILWTASKRNDSLTEDDVCMYLNLNVDVDVNKGDISVAIVPEMKEWTLEEVLEYVNSIHGTV